MMKALVATFFLLQLRNTACGGDENAVLDDEPPPDTRYFEDALRSPYFVDKTIFTKDVIDESKRYKLLVAPKNFGKSTLLDMLRRFYQAPIDPKTLTVKELRHTYYYDLFRNTTLKISEFKEFFSEYCGRFNVIYLTYEGIHGNTEMEIRQDMRRRIRHTLMAHEWLYRDVLRRFDKQKHFLAYSHDVEKMRRVIQGLGNEYDSVMALKALMRMLKLYFKNEIVVLIDDYDAPLQRALSLGIKPNDIYSVIQRVLDVFVRTTCYARYVLITGVSRLYHQPIGDVLITLRHYCYTNDYEQVRFYGFLEEEVEELVERKKLDKQAFIKLKQNHNGYVIENYKLALYNPGGVRRFFENNSLDYEFPDDIIPNIMQCLRHRIFFNQFAMLIWNRKVVKKIDKVLTMNDLEHFVNAIQKNCSHYYPPASYATPFFDNGYLTFTNIKDTYQVPNRIFELRLREIFRNYYEDKYQINITNAAIATIMYSIANAEITTDKMLATLNSTLNELFWPLRDRQLSEYESYCLLYTAVFSNLRANRDAIYVRDLARPYELPFTADKLVLMSDEQNTMVIVKLTFQQTLETAIEQARQLVPTPSVNHTTINLVKYLGISIHQNGTVMVGRGSRRRTW